MKSLSIGEVARKTGIRTSALRFYEEAGILPEPARVNGRRIYEADAIRRMDVLRFAPQAGFTLEEIKTLFHGFGAETPLSVRWKALVRAKLAELDVLATRIQRMRLALRVGLKCGCVRVEDCSLSPADVPELKRSRAKASTGCGC
jgi:MerR family redox-sensitive transcriptional activator SoxR